MSDLDPTNAEHVAGVLAITRGYWISREGARRVSGSHIVAYVYQTDENGNVYYVDGEVPVKRQSFRIPKGHPWRGKRP